MAEYIDKEKALSTLENTAKYYEMPNADEWTKGIHYGLLHGVDNIVDNVPTADVVEREKIDKAIKVAEDYISAYFKLGLNERAFGMREILEIFKEI